LVNWTPGAGWRIFEKKLDGSLDVPLADFFIGLQGPIPTLHHVAHQNAITPWVDAAIAHAGAVC